jgi:hypothetical protein
MARPSKFDMGEMPRTRTGLIPASYRQKIEELSFPWSQLPAKPKPQMYRYRGDYVNEQNRKLQIKRKLAMKHTQRSFECSNAGENEGLGSILKITPCNSINADAKSSSKNLTGPHRDTNVFISRTENWDPYHKHESIHKLSEDEECARARNKSKFVSYLRAEALKRQERKGKETTDTNEHKLHCAEVFVRQRKPPVPRLSHLARSRESKEYHLNGKQQLLRQTKSKLICTTLEDQSKEGGDVNAESTKAKADYLDFISKKNDSLHVQPVERNGHGAPHLKPNVNNDEDDETTFRNQIQRIVERAAEMVLNEQNDHLKNQLGNDNSDYAPVKSTRHCQEAKRNLYSSDDFFEMQNKKLSMLEAQVSSIASSVVSENDHSFVSYDTDDILDHFVQRDNNPVVETTLGTGKLGTKAMGRSNTQKIIDTPRQHCKSMIDFLNSSNSSSSCDTSYFSELYPQIHGRNGKAGKALVDENSTTTCTSTTFWSGSDTVTELVPRLHVESDYTLHSRPHLDPCPIETLPPPVSQSDHPSKESLWEDEPLPRGCEHLSRYDTGEEMIYQRTEDEACSQNVRSESLADELFSLL